MVSTVLSTSMSSVPCSTSALPDRMSLPLDDQQGNQLEPKYLAWTHVDCQQDSAGTKHSIGLGDCEFVCTGPNPPDREPLDRLMPLTTPSAESHGQRSR